MAGIYTDFWKIVKPSAPKNNYVTDNPDDFKLYSNFSWYSKVMKGAGSRFQKYSQYKNMDGDVFVSRALDQIAAEMTSEDTKSNLPFKITYQSEANEEVPENIVVTVRAALRHWCDIHNLSKLSFDIARMAVKFGDCFFRKTSDFKIWEYVEPNDVVGIHIDKDTGKPQFYQVRKGDSSDKNSFGDAEIVPAAGMIHFSLSSGIGDNGPFGESVLYPVIKAFRHLTLLQDSVIIYRIVRAPERRVFSIDVGNMPPQRAKSYLEAIKNEIRQKRVPNETGGQEKMDSVYNPMCWHLSTRIPLLDGRTLSLSELIIEHEAGKQNWAYSADPVTGKLAPGLISWAGVTRKDAELVKLILDNGAVMICTPDHRFPTLGGDASGTRADELTTETSLLSFERRQSPIAVGSKARKNLYEQVFDHSTNEWIFTHKMVAESLKISGEIVIKLYKDLELSLHPIIHHLNYDRFNNEPSNLAFMNKADHMLFHRQQKLDWWATISADRKSEIKSLISEGTKLAMAKGDQSYKIKQTQALKKWNENHKLNDSYTIDRINAGRKSIDNTSVITQELLGKFMQHVKAAKGDRTKALELANADVNLVAQYKELNPRYAHLEKVVNKRFLQSIYWRFNYEAWPGLAASCSVYNHRIISIERLSERADTGCITIDGEHKYHSHHTFALEAGVFTKNSMTEDYFFMQTADGRGSKVDTLSGGENLGEIKDLNYFQNIFLQGLRIPSSYMRGSDDNGSQVQDGKVGVAYMEERNFFKYIQRLQRNMNPTYDKEFKAYLKSAGIRVDSNLFKIELNDPQDFDIYKQAEVDEKLMSNFNNIKDIPFIAARVKLKRYLGWSEDEIQMNEEVLKKELGIPTDDIDERMTVLRMLYDPKWLENRPEPKVDASWDNHVEASKRQVSPEEQQPEEDAEAAPEEEAEEGGEEEAPADEPQDDTPSLDDMKRTLES